MVNVEKFAKAITDIAYNSAPVLTVREKLPILTEALDLKRNKEWYMFCVRHDVKKKVLEYFDLSREDFIDGDGNLLVDLFKAEEITRALVDRAFRATVPINLSTIKKSKAIRDCITNERLAIYIKEDSNNYDASFAEENGKSISMRLLPFWKDTSNPKYKKEMSFEKAFGLDTPIKQLNALHPAKNFSDTSKLEVLKQRYKLYLRLNLGEAFDKAVTAQYDFVRRYWETYYTTNTFSTDRVDKVLGSVLFIDDEKENDLLLAYSKLLNKDLPSINYDGRHRYVQKACMLIADYIVAKNSEPLTV